MGTEEGPAEGADKERLAREEREPGLRLCTISSPRNASPLLAEAVVPTLEIQGGEGHVEALPAAPAAEGPRGPLDLS